MNKTTTPAAVQSSNKGLGSIGKFGCQSKYFAVPEFDYSCTTIMDSSKGLRHLQLLLLEAPAGTLRPLYAMRV